MLRKYLGVLLVVLALFVLGVGNASAGTITVDITAANPELLAMDIEPCTWYRLGPGIISWTVHAVKPIWDMHFVTWDDANSLEPGITPFPNSHSACTGAPDYKQTLDLSGSGTVLPASSKWQITFSAVPKLNNVPQPIWFHPTTPEPGTLRLLACGLAGLVPALRRRRRVG
jgi:hypothetical protein